MPPRLVWHFSSPFRNPAGMKARAEVMGMDAVYDPGSLGETEEAVEGLVRREPGWPKSP